MYLIRTNTYIRHLQCLVIHLEKCSLSRAAFPNIFPSWNTNPNPYLTVKHDIDLYTHMYLYIYLFLILDFYHTNTKVVVYQ